MKVDLLAHKNGIDMTQGVVKNRHRTEKLSFSELLDKSINQVNRLLMESDRLDEMAMLGEVENLHQVVIGSQKAELALQYTIQIRNKILDAYHEIMRMPM